MIGPDTAYYRRLARWCAAPAYQLEIEALATALDGDPGGAPLPRDARVLDLGCGTGTGLRLLQQRGWRMIGADLSPAATAVCDHRPLVLADAAALPFPTASFDAVVLMHVLAHLQDPLGSLREAFRVLAPGGRLGLVTPDARHLKALRRCPPGDPAYRPDPTVEQHFGREELKILIGAAAGEAGVGSIIRPLGPALTGVAARPRLLLLARSPAA